MKNYYRKKNKKAVDHEIRKAHTGLYEVITEKFSSCALLNLDESHNDVTRVWWRIARMVNIQLEDDVDRL